MHTCTCISKVNHKNHYGTFAGGNAPSMVTSDSFLNELKKITCIACTGRPTYTVHCGNFLHTVA